MLRKGILEGNSLKFLERDPQHGNDELPLVSKWIDSFLDLMHDTLPDESIEKSFYYMLIREALVHSNKDVTIFIFS